MSTTLTSKANDYKVADINLADWGRKEIQIAEKEMPGLISIRDVNEWVIRDQRETIDSLIHAVKTVRPPT